MSKRKGILFKDVYDDFLIHTSKRRKKQGFQTLERNFKNHILPYFNDKDITSITRKEIIDWQNIILDKNYSNGFNSLLYWSLSSFFEFCKDNLYIEENPIRKVKKFNKKVEFKEYDYYTLKEFKIFRKHMKNLVIKEFFNFIFFNGTRPGETMALRFKDLNGSYIHVCHNLQRKGKRELDTPKNSSSIRYLKLSLPIRIRIFILKCFYIKKYGQCLDDYYIFGGPKPLSPTTIDRHKKETCLKANIREITQHQFRHSYTTNAIHNNVSIDEVSKNLGHSKVSMTVDVYLHNKKGVINTPHIRNKFFQTLERNFKNIFQYIITRFYV